VDTADKAHIEKAKLTAEQAAFERHVELPGSDRAGAPALTWAKRIAIFSRLKWSSRALACATVP